MGIENLEGKDPEFYGQSLKSPAVETDMGALKPKMITKVEAKPKTKEKADFAPQPIPTPLA